MSTRRCFLAYGVLATFLVPGVAAAQQGPGSQGIGIVTAVQGQATVSRASLPRPAALHFKDDVFFRDQIATRERATVRLLLGGKGTLTIREQSQVTLDESVSQDGRRQSVVGLLAGKIGAAIARALMGPGETVEIRTPNAVAAVRGTVLIAEYIPPEGSAQAPRPVLLASAGPGPLMAQAPGGGGTSNFIVLSGHVNVTIPGMPPITLGPLQAVQITSTPAGIQPGALQTLTPAQAAQAAQGLGAIRSQTGDPGASKVAQAQATVAAAVANVILQATTGRPGAFAPPTSITTPSAPTTLVAPVVPQVPPSSLTPNNLPSGPLLKLNNVILTLADEVALATFSAGSPNAITPLEFSGSGEEAPVIEVPGPLLTVIGNPITHSGSVVKLDGGAGILNTPGSPAPLARIDGTNLTNSGGPVFDLNGGSAVGTLGPVLQLDNGANATLAGVMNLQGDTEGFLGPADALVIKNGSSVTATDALFSLTGNSALATGGSLVFLDPSTLVLQAPILSLTGDSEAILFGHVLHAVDSTVTSSQPLVSLQGNGMLTSMSGPFVQVSGGSLTADSIVKAQGEAATIALHGSLLDLTDSTATFRVLTDIFNGGFTQTLGVGEPVVQLTNSNLTLTEPGAPLAGFSTDSPGVALIASNTSGTTKTIGLAGPLLKLTGGDYTLDAATPQVQLSNMRVEQTGTDALINVGSSCTTVKGPLLQADYSDLNLAGSLMSVSAGSDISADTVSDPLIKLTGGTHEIGSATDSTTGSLLDLRGVDACDGPCRPLGTGGSIIELNGATINTMGSGNAIRVDTALLEAVAPIINMINSTLTTSATGDATTGAMHLYQSQVTSWGPVFGLDKSTLTVNDGPLLSLTGGTNMTVIGDFASLTNGSKITVLNGPLIRVDGYNSLTKAPSTLNVTGALVNFGGTGGNQIIVNNTIIPTATQFGLPVHAGEGSSVTIGSNPIRNPDLGTIRVTGSVIQATGGGKVTISGTEPAY